MSTHTNYSSDQVGTVSPLRKFAWSVRRELWEHRSLYIAPCVIAMVALAAYLYLLFRSAGYIAKLSTQTDIAQRAFLISPFNATAFAIMATTALATFYYSVDALYAERRDRSILFWKSLPISDTHAVLSKLAVPLIAMVPIEIGIIAITQLAQFIAASVFFTVTGAGAALLWKHFSFFDMITVVSYGIVTGALWFAPIYAWLLLVSAWARRGPFLWAVVPPVALMLVERIATGQANIQTLLYRRIFGAQDVSFVANAAAAASPRGTSGGASATASATTGVDVSRVLIPDPVKFISSAELWIGLAMASVFIFIAIRLRHSRAPI